MKGKEHIIGGLSLITLFLLTITHLLYSKRVLFKTDSWPFDEIIIVVGLLLVVLISFFAGVLSPDADLRKGRSKIFFSPFSWMILFLRLVESRTITKKKGHRGFLHTIRAGLLSTIFFSSLIFTILFLITRSLSESTILVFLFSIPYLLGYTTHLVQDFLADHFGSLALTIWSLLLIILFILFFIILNSIIRVF